MKAPEEYFELAENETITTTCRPAKVPRWIFYLVTLGLYEFWRRATVYAVTDRRVVARNGIITRTEGSLPLFYVQDATIQTFLWWGRIHVSTAGGESGDLETLSVPKESAQELRRVILDRAHEMRDGRAPTAEPRP
jgi:membrane protein YdbS with pleckstrin-like domain